MNAVYLGMKQFLPCKVKHNRVGTVSAAIKGAEAKNRSPNDLHTRVLQSSPIPFCGPAA